MNEQPENQEERIPPFPLKTPLETPLIETYYDVEKLIHEVVYKFFTRYGGDREELLAEANLCFMLRYRNAEAGHGAKFSTWLQYKIWYALLDYMNKQTKYKIRYHVLNKESNETELKNARSRTNFDWNAFLADLSPDAQYVAQLTVEPEPDVVLNAKGGYKRSDRKKISRGLFEFLQDMGWEEKRIKRSFQEICEALE